MKDATRQFLVGALRAHLTGNKTPSATLPAEAVDWDALVPLAEFHRVAPLLDRGLRDGGGTPIVPAAVRAELAAYTRSVSSRSLLLTGELVRLLKQLQAQGIPALPFKGPALAFLLYGDPALRHFDDLDLLVRRQDFAAARSVLLAIGCQPKAQCAHHESFTLARGDSEIKIELHWNIVDEDFPMRLDIAGVWERCVAFSLASVQTTAFAPEDLLLFLCMHGAKHLWLRLQWLCDVAQLVRRHATLDWGRVVEQARIAGGQRALFLGIFLANDLLAAPLPPEIEQKVRHDRPTLKLAGLVKARLWYGPPAEVFRPWQRANFRLQLIDRGRDRFAYAPRYWFNILIAPKSTDRDRVPLPKALSPLYYVLRPLRLAAKYGLAAVNQFRHRHREM